MAGLVKSQPNSVTTFIIGGAASKSTTSDPSQINAKEIAVFLADGSNTRATESNVTGGSKVKLCYKDNNGDIHWSPEIPASATVRARQYAAATEQIDYVGFNGSTGSITATNDYKYELKVVLRTSITSSIDGKSFPTYMGFYKSDASATQNEIMDGLYLNFRSATSTKRNPDFVKTERIMAATSDNSLGTGTATSATIVFTNGSKRVSGWADVDDATTNDALAVGDYLRIGTAATDPVYKIASIDATNDVLVLDAPFTGTTVTLNDTGLRVIPAADAVSLACGLKLSGVAQDWTLDRYNFENITFETLDPTGKLGVTNSQSSKRGAGTYKEVAEAEFFYVTSDGSMDALKTPPTEFPRSLLASSTIGGYDLWVISWSDASNSGIFSGTFGKTVMVAVPTDRGEAAYAATGATDDIADVLEAYFTSITSIAAAGTALSSNKLEGTITS